MRKRCPLTFPLLLALACMPCAILAAHSPAPASSSQKATKPLPLTPVNASKYFAEAKHDCRADDGHLWGISLCGPMMFVDRRNHHIITNQADAAGKLKKLTPGVYIGRLPPDQPVANTAVEWAGVRWTQVLWPLPGNPAVRRTLLAHEAFHRVQKHIAPIHRAGSNAQLDTLQGRYTMQLEWRALGDALSATDAAEARHHITDALLFRAARYRRFPDAQKAEVALERNEGLAEYTGIMIGNHSPAQRIAMARRDLSRHVDDPSFVRSFAYATGPAYGLLLDRFAPGWRRHIGSGKGLAGLLAAGLDIDLAHMPTDTLAQRAQHYDGPTLLASETTREQRRSRKIAHYHAQLVAGPVLILPLEHMQVQFDPRTLLPLGDAGTVYPEIRVSDDWGSLDATGGALMASNWKRLTVIAPDGEAKGGKLHGKGWTLKLAPGWHLGPSTRNGDVTLVHTDQ